MWKHVEVKVKFEVEVSSPLTSLDRPRLFQEVKVPDIITKARIVVRFSAHVPAAFTTRKFSFPICSTTL